MDAVIKLGQDLMVVILDVITASRMLDTHPVDKPRISYNESRYRNNKLEG